MIGRLKGTVEVISEHGLILDVQGVGYSVSVSHQTLQDLKIHQENLSLWIETLVRPESLQLFGFITSQEQEFFRLLTSVQGVGARMALNILSIFSPDQLVGVISAQDKTLLTRAEGVGPKLATRLVNELKDKVAKIKNITFEGVPSSSPSQAFEDALSALCHLGYGRFEAQKSLQTSEKALGKDAPFDQLIRLSLQELSTQNDVTTAAR